MTCRPLPQYTHNVRGQRGQLPRAQQAKGGVKQLHQNVFEQGTQKVRTTPARTNIVQYMSQKCNLSHSDFCYFGCQLV